MYRLIQIQKRTGEVAEFQTVASLFNTHEDAVEYCMEYINLIRTVNYNFYLCEV